MTEFTSPQEFVEFFVKKHGALIKRIGRRYLIPNRYSLQDIEAYVVERVLSIMTARQTSENKILDPEKYFLNCLYFYCIEYQRLNGFIFCLPKRPRKNAIEDELEAKGRDFHYFNDTMLDDSSLIASDLDAPDPGIDSRMWHALTGYLFYDDARVIECIHKKGMTLKETSLDLGVAQSTCLTRRDRAYKTIFTVFDTLTGEMSENLKGFLRMDNRDQSE
jgi:hypothetical protein